MYLVAVQQHAQKHVKARLGDEAALKKLIEKEIAAFDFDKALKDALAEAVRETLKTAVFNAVKEAAQRCLNDEGWQNDLDDKLQGKIVGKKPEPAKA